MYCLYACSCSSARSTSSSSSSVAAFGVHAGERVGERLELRPANASAIDGVRGPGEARLANGVDGVRRSSGRGDENVDDARWNGESERRPSNGEPRTLEGRRGELFRAAGDCVDDSSAGRANTSRAGDALAPRASASPTLGSRTAGGAGRETSASHTLNTSTMVKAPRSHATTTSTNSM